MLDNMTLRKRWHLPNR